MYSSEGGSAERGRVHVRVIVTGSVAGPGTVWRERGTVIERVGTVCACESALVKQRETVFVGL